MEAIKGKEKDSSLEPPEKNAALEDLNFSPVKPILDCKIINLCCLKFVVISFSSYRKLPVFFQVWSSDLVA